MIHADEKDLENEMPQSDAEWRVRRAMEENEVSACTEIFQRLRRIYRVYDLEDSPEIYVFLRDMTYFTYECEQNARRNGAVLKPLSSLELESAFPLSCGATSELIGSCRDGKEEPDNVNERSEI